jgi:hypothetical protein
MKKDAIVASLIEHVCVPNGAVGFFDKKSKGKPNNPGVLLVSNNTLKEL